MKLKARKEKNETRKEMKIKKKRKGNKLGGREGDKKNKKHWLVILKNVMVKLRKVWGSLPDTSILKGLDNYSSRS